MRSWRRCRATMQAAQVPEICVHIDYDTMLHGLHERSLCETADGIPLPPATVRRLACEAAIVPITLNSAGEVLDCGRDVRVANRPSGGRYGRCTAPAPTPTATSRSTAATSTTSSPGSTTDRTDLGNLLPLCGRHHHLVHEGHWRLTLDKHRVVTIHRPDGTRHFHGTTINRTRRARPDVKRTAREPGRRRSAPDVDLDHRGQRSRSWRDQRSARERTKRSRLPRSADRCGVADETVRSRGLGNCRAAFGDGSPGRRWDEC